MSVDMSYKFRKEEIQKNGSIYYKKGFGKNEKPFMNPCDYGSLRNESKKRGNKR